MTGLHHVELWVVDLPRASAEWGWQMELQLVGEWPEGRSWSAGGAYLTVTTSPNLHGSTHDRRRPGVKVEVVADAG